jgi:hypothetical protein
MTRKELLKAKKKSDVIDRYGYDRDGNHRYSFSRDGKNVRIYGVVLTTEEYDAWMALPE